MSDTETLYSFADDTFVPNINESLLVLLEDMRKYLDALTKWLKDSGLKVSKSKTELHLFCKKDVAPVTVILKDVQTVSKR
jgi:hypothetical protein